MDRRKEKNLFIWICLSPAVILVTLFMVIPTINVFRMSLYKWTGYSQNQTFVGLDNFKILWKDMTFFKSFQNSLLLIAIVTTITLVFALAFASILSREKLRGQNLFRIVFYIPNILSVVVISAIFSAIYDPETGLLNSILGILKLDGLQRLWLGDQKIVIFAIAGAMVWQAIGYYMVMYMASMANIPDSLYEASSLEGAGRLEQFFSITLPLVWGQIRTTLIFFIISTINLSFLFVKTMTNGGPDGATEVFLSYMYKQAYTNSSYGYGMTIGVVVFIFSFILSAVMNKVTKREPLEF